MEGKSLALVLKCPDHQEGPQTRSPDANPKHVGKRLTRRRLHRAADHVLGKSLDPVNLCGNVGLRSGIWGKVWAAQPVMAHLTSFIGIGDRPGFEGCHRSKG